MNTVSLAPCARAGSEVRMTDQSKSMLSPAPAAGSSSALRRLGPAPLLVVRAVASVGLDPGQRTVHLGPERAALGKADAVFVGHHLRAHGLDFALAGGGDEVEHVGRVM